MVPGAYQTRINRIASYYDRDGWIRLKLPIAVWMMRSFLADIPVQLFEPLLWMALA